MNIIRRWLQGWLWRPEEEHHYMGFDVNMFVCREDEQDVTDSQVGEFNDRFIELVEGMGMFCGGGLTPACAWGEDTPHDRKRCPARKRWLVHMKAGQDKE